MKKIIFFGISLTLTLVLTVSSNAIKWENKTLDTGGSDAPAETSDNAVKNYNEKFKKKIIDEPNLNSVPRLLLKVDASIWDSDFRENPALLDPKSEFEFFYDVYYLGGLTRVSTDIYSRLFSNALGGGVMTGSLDENYVSNNVGTDAGFTIKLNDISSLAAIFSYRYGIIKGDGDYWQYWEGGVNTSEMTGTSRSDDNNSTYGLSLLYNANINDYISVGAGFKYAFMYDNSEYEMTALGDHVQDMGIAGIVVFPENVNTVDELTFNYHLFSPTLGVSIKPNDSLIINSAITGNIYTGNVEKSATLFDDYMSNRFPRALSSNVYTENLDGGKIKGYEISANLEPEFKINDTVSIPALVKYSQGDIQWNVDGNGTGYFAPLSYSGIFHGPGTIDYEGKQREWEIVSGAGVKLNINDFDIRGSAYYTHNDYYSAYYSENIVNPTILVGNQIGGLTSYTTRTSEEKDIVSLTLGVGKEIHPQLIADFSLRYDLGWGEMNYYEAYHSPYAHGNPGTIVYVNTDGADSYQDLTLSSSFTYTPINRLSLLFGGTVKLPLDPLNYNMTGTGTGGRETSGNGQPRFYEGGATRGSNSRSWDYGGTLKIKFEF